MKNLLFKSLSKEEIKLFERLKNEMDSESWSELVASLDRLGASESELSGKMKWKMAAQALTYLVNLYSQVIKEEAGLEVYYKISKEVWSEISYSLKDLLQPLKIDSNDASSVHYGVRTFSRVIMGPELDFELVEAKKDRSVIRIYRCPWHQIMIETGLQSFCEPHHEVHETFCRSMVKALNPDMTFRFTQHTSAHSLPYCEEVVEFKPKGVIAP